MLINVIRKLLSHVGLQEVSDADITRLINTIGLSKLPPYLVFGIATVYPIIELAIKKVKKEDMDWSALAE